MRTITRILGCIVLYLVFLAWRFPYQAAVDQAVRRFEAATGARVDYNTQSASLFGVTLRDVKVHFSTGVEARFSSAYVRTGFSGVAATLTQAGGSAKASLDQSGKLTLALDKVQVDSGSAEFNQVKATGDVAYSLVRREGSGDLRVEVPKFRAALPIPDMETLDIGTKLTVTNEGGGHKIRADVHAVGGQEFNADGQVQIGPAVGSLSPPLSGTLNVKIPAMKPQTIRLEGTWNKPRFTPIASAT